MNLLEVFEKVSLGSEEHSTAQSALKPDVLCVLAAGQVRVIQSEVLLQGGLVLSKEKRPTNFAAEPPQVGGDQVEVVHTKVVC